jgi:hypothetical protein
LASQLTIWGPTTKQVRKWVVLVCDKFAAAGVDIENGFDPPEPFVKHGDEEDPQILAALVWRLLCRIVDEALCTHTSRCERDSRGFGEVVKRFSCCYVQLQLGTQTDMTWWPSYVPHVIHFVGRHGDWYIRLDA